MRINLCRLPRAAGIAAQPRTSRYSPKVPEGEKDRGNKVTGRRKWREYGWQMGASWQDNTASCATSDVGNKSSVCIRVEQKRERERERERAEVKKISD